MARILTDTNAFIVAGGELTKAARNWLGNKLDATKRSQIMFMDRDVPRSTRSATTFRFESRTGKAIVNRSTFLPAQNKSALPEPD
jgi:hypothetical protein